MKKRLLYFLAVAIVLINGCQKEKSFEQPNNPSEGSLQSDVSGDCLPKTVNGTYEAGTALVPGTNTISIQVDVTKTGTYLITTDTVNGFYFRATGTFTTLGTNSISLRGNGTPFTSGTFNFVVSYDSTVCDVQVTVLPSGAGGPAVFTLEGTGNPASCSGATAAGNYIIGTALNSSNKVTLSVNVTTIGTYNITTAPAVNGMTFAGIGAFLTTGVQPVVLTGSGTPTGTPGAVTIPVTVGTSNCNFQVTTVAGATFAFNCASAVVNGTYQAGTALGSGNTVDIDVNVLTTGPYSISTTATNGMVFTASGNFTMTGTTNIQLTGTGTPSAGGTFNIPMPGTPTCSFSVTCTAAATVDWKFTEGTTTYQGTSISAQLNSVPPITLLAYLGDNGSGISFTLALGDISGGINGGENYAMTSTTSNNSTLLVTDGMGNTLYEGNATISGLTFKVTVTSHNTTTKTIIGTFSGTVKDGSGATKTISNGTFTAVYS
ncbi:MAG TPA: hypothetical protein PKC72_13140 [Chitinophagaceae bacterium]|nr:hypothetical protein [Chitinophagaceae bacterium]